MFKSVASFFSLYLAILLLQSGAGLFNTYIGLRLTAGSVSEVWVGALIAAYYAGLVCGARIGHKVIIRVGHIRAYGAAAAVATATVLALALVDNLWVWLAFRFVAGIGMVTQFMVIESWLNEQTENHLRGRIFAFYMVFSGAGTVSGQLSLTLFPHLDYQPLVFVAICMSLCLVPIALTGRVHPAIQKPAPIYIKYYLARVPMSLLVFFVAGNINGAFYGLAPVYGAQVGMTNSETAVYLAVAVAAGLASQWPMGWLADRVNRAGLIRINALMLLLLTLPLWGWWHFPFWALLLFSAAYGILQFTLYPLGAAFANDNVDPERRVGLSAMLLMVYGVGACLGPLFVGLLMRHIDTGMFYAFVSCCALVLVAFVRPRKVTGAHLSQDAPTNFVPMPDSLQASPVVAELDPRVDVQSDISRDPILEQTDGETPQASEVPADGSIAAGLETQSR
ncbi:MFS transporter [Candidimonas nitroreducens]|uniref:MFS transporter n=1 Tax=Candidimonas nitroreducens TaxID=683354 RepID=A0A225MR35_9BURK|nr:MFS transporter [Candidimonas nitroreducens]OWT61921.1 MFS transporter [Candidimonas nitroreducens]